MRSGTGRTRSFIAGGARTALRLTLAAVGLISALGLSACPSADKGSADAAAVKHYVVADLAGTWVNEQGVTVTFEGDHAQLISFGDQRVTGRQFFDVGNLYFSKLKSFDEDTIAGWEIRFYADDAGDGALHIVEQSTIGVHITFKSDHELSVDGGIAREHFQRVSAAKNELVYGGACEQKVSGGETTYECDDSGTQPACDAVQTGETKFWKNTTCSQLGYAYQYANPARFRHDESSNTTPGAQGEWGDKSGGSGRGWSDGSGGAALVNSTPSDAGVVGPGTSADAGTSSSGSIDGGTPQPVWSKWLFVDSDKPVQFQMALVKDTGSYVLLQLQYRVTMSDPVYSSGAGGYGLVADTTGEDGNELLYTITFSGQSEEVFPLPDVLRIDTAPGGNRWRSDTNMLWNDSLNGPPDFPYSCVDDVNNPSGRCGGFGTITTSYAGP